MISTSEECICKILTKESEVNPTFCLAIRFKLYQGNINNTFRLRILLFRNVVYSSKGKQIESIVTWLIEFFDMKYDN